MRKYLLHVLIISFVFLLTPACDVAKTVEEIEIEIEDAKEEVRKNPDDAKAHNGLGYTYDELGKYEEAIKPYKQAIRIDPDFKEAHYNLGVCYIGIRDKSSALKQPNILKNLILKGQKNCLA